MSVLRTLVRKEFLQLRRDRKMLPIVIIAPVMQLVVLGYAANLDVRNLPTAVMDLDRTQASRELVERFVATEYFDHVLTIRTRTEAERALVGGTARVVLVVPEGFSRSLLRGEPAEVQLLIDGANSTIGSSTLNYGNRIIGALQQDLVAARVPRGAASGVPAGTALGAPVIEVVPRVWFNPGFESRNFMVPGILALLLMVITMLLSSLAIVKEKELGTLEQLNVTPISPLQLIVGKLIPFIVIGFADVLLVVVVSRFVMGVPFRGSLPLLLLMSLLFLATTLGLGLLISTVSANQQQAMLTSVFFVMVPMFFLSGFAFPIESMPPIIQWLTYLLPLRYFFVIIRGIFLKGAGLEVLWDEALAMLGFGLAILALAAARFRKRAG